MNNPILTCQELGKTFREGSVEVAVLRGVNLSIAAGEMVAIVGPSGSGKSTLLHLLGGLETPSRGQVAINNVALDSLTEREKGGLRNRYLGFIYQFHHLLPEFDVLENVCMPLLIGGIAPKQAIPRACDILAKVGLSARTQHRIGELSGGERQRVAIARALVTNPQCVLADEPTGNLDYKTALQVYELLFELNQNLHTAFLLVTHDLGIAQKMQRVLTLEAGLLV